MNEPNKETKNKYEKYAKELDALKEKLKDDIKTDFMKMLNTKTVVKELPKTTSSTTDNLYIPKIERPWNEKAELSESIEVEKLVEQAKKNTRTYAIMKNLDLNETHLLLQNYVNDTL